MSKIKWLKYVLASAALLVVCAGFALADSDDVVCTLNGQPYTDVKAAANAAQPGDYLNIFGDSSFTGGLRFTSGVNVYVAPSATLTTASGYVVSEANVNWYGTLLRTNASGSATTYGVGVESGVFNFFGKVISNPTSGTGLQTLNSGSANGLINVYGGQVIGSSASVRAATGQINVYGGSFTPMFEPSSTISLANGAQIVESNNVSWGGLYEIGRIVSSACQWIALFCAVVVTNKLLLIFIIVVFSALGIGLIKRVVR